MTLPSLLKHGTLTKPDQSGTVVPSVATVNGTPGTTELRQFTVNSDTAGRAPFISSFGDKVFLSTNDPTWYLGYNVKTDGNLVLGGEDGVNWGIEGHYNDGTGNPKAEMYAQFINASDLSFHRPFYAQWDKTTKTVTLVEFDADQVSFLNSAKTVQFAVFAGSSVRFNQVVQVGINGAAGIVGLNHSGSGFVELARINTSDQPVFDSPGAGAVFGGNLTVGGVVTSGGATPSLNTGGGWGSTPTKSITGSNQAHEVSITPGGTGIATDPAFEVNWANPTGATPKAVLVTPGNLNAKALGVPYLTLKNSSVYDIHPGGNPVSGTVYTYEVLVSW